MWFLLPEDSPYWFPKGDFRIVHKYQNYFWACRDEWVSIVILFVTLLQQSYDTMALYFLMSDAAGSY
jgi:hypothetical protein